MSTLRSARKEARTRGSGKRAVNVSDFSIKIDGPAFDAPRYDSDDQDEEPVSVKSRKLKQEDISDDFFALHVRTDPTTSRKRSSKLTETRKKPKTSRVAKAEPMSDEFVITDLDTGEEPERRNTSRFKTRTEPPVKQDRQLKQSKSPKSIPKSSQTSTSKVKSARHKQPGKPFKSQTIGRIASVDLRQAFARDAEIVEAIPLSKSKWKERQKPLLIDVERLVNERSASKRVKINTIDVLKYLVQTFEPRIQSNGKVDAEVVDQEFKMHLLNYFNVLQDMHASINDLTEEIQEVQRRKRDLRQQLFEVRKKHGEVGSELSKLRQEYLDSKYNHGQFTKAAEQLQALKERASRNDGFSDLHSVVEADLTAARKLVNPVSGIYSKLRVINDQLENRLN